MWYITHLPPEEMKKSWFIDESKDRIEFNGLFLSVHTLSKCLNVSKQNLKTFLKQVDINFV